MYGTSDYSCVLKGACETYHLVMSVKRLRLLHNIG